MEQTFFKLRKIVRIVTQDEILSTNFKFIDGEFINNYSKKKIDDDYLDYYLVKEEKLYNKPECRIYLSNDKCKTFYLNSFEEAEDKAKEIMDLTKEEWV